MLNPSLIAATCPAAAEENIVFWRNYRVTVLAEQLFRVEISDKKLFCDDATQVVWYRNQAPVSFRTEEKDGAFVIRTAKAALVLKESWEDSFVQLGRKKVPLDNRGNLGGTYRTLDMCDGDQHYHHDGTKGSIIRFDNGVVSRSGVAVLDDSDSLLLKADGRVCRREYEEKDYYVFAYGHDYRAAVRGLLMICGPVPKLPRFVFGNWWSRYHAYSEKEYMHILDTLEEEGIPLTVAVIDMDWHWSNAEEMAERFGDETLKEKYLGNSAGWTGYSWNTRLFPDYRRFLKKLHDRRLAVTLNVHPKQGVRWFEDQYEDMCKAVGQDPAEKKPVEFDLTDDAFTNAYFDILHHPFEKDGVDFWWLDWQQGKASKLAGLDPLWQVNHYHFLDSAREHMPMILSRYAGIGSHRYPLGFSGDTFCTWKSLDYLPYFTNNAANVGYGWWSHDIGGHFFGFKDNEMYLRYVQYGAFNPISRLHCTSRPVQTKEPSTYNAGSGMIADSYLRLRHQMIPFLYSASLRSAQEGDALCEPMYYSWPEEPEAYRVPNEYLFGGVLILRPITQKSDRKNLTAVRVWLPEGHYTDIFTGDEYDGGRTVTMVRWLENFPALMPSGGFFVMDGRKELKEADEPDVLKVLCTNGDGSYLLREDSGDTLFTAKAEAGCQITELRPAAGTKDRTVRLEFRNIMEDCLGEVTVKKNGRKIAFTADDNGTASVTFRMEAGAVYTVSVEYSHDERALKYRQLLYSMQRFERAYVKNEQLERALFAAPTEEWESIIKEAELTVNERLRLLELL